MVFLGLLLLATLLSGAAAAGLELSLPPQCGRTPSVSSPLTLNGQKAGPGAFPWHAAIYLKRADKHDFLCGGSLLTASTIITAAHCFFQNGEELPPERFSVALGKTYSGWDHEEGSPIHKSEVQRILPHALYQGIRRKYANDAAVLEMTTPANFTSSVYAVCMSQNVRLGVGEQITVVGWGSDAKNASPLAELASVTLNYKPFSECLEAIGHNAHEVSFVTSDKFCSSRDDAEKLPPGLAKGDSGGGVVARRNGRWYLVGIVSVSLDEGRLYVFTDVKKQSPWITEATSPSDQQPQQQQGGATAPGSGSGSGHLHGLRWVSMANNGVLPDRSLKAGYQRIGGHDNPHFVGRVFYRDAIVPGTVTKYGEHWQLFTAWEGVPTNTFTFEMAVVDEDRVRWVPGARGSVPEGAAVAGIAADGESLYVCRVFDNKASPSNAHHQLMLTPGVLRPSGGKCTVEFFGANDYRVYEVLVVL